MPATEIITIINNSGKVISTGKHLVGIFKEAQAAYRDRKEAVKAQRAGIQRAKTFDVAHDPSYDDYYRYEQIEYADDRRFPHDGPGRRRSYDDDDRSHASSRYSRRSRRTHRPPSPGRLPALTEGNLQTHSEVSATSPSKTYRAPYAETAPRDMQLSRPALPMGLPPLPSALVTSEALVPAPRQELVHRVRPDPPLPKKKSIDMNLAYGELPPDLASRVDLDPDHHHTPPAPLDDPRETQALTLVDRIEDLLDEAHCVHHTASSMIENLQRSPEAAAAVALSLAELSALLGKMSPAALAFLKGGSPAVFALLASPQFLIGAGVAVGVTVVMFGGWKIVKRIKDSALNTPAKTLEAPLSIPALPPTSADKKPLPAPSAYDEALVLKDVEELSTIETWRRGIVTTSGDDGGDDESADIELMSRAAERTLREQHSVRHLRLEDEVEPCDSVSQVSSARTHRSRRTERTERSARSARTRLREEERGGERRSNAGTGVSKKKDRDGGERSEAGSERSHRSHKSQKSKKEGGSTVSKASSKASSKHGSKVSSRVVEEAGSTTSRPREKKRDMIKQLFKMKKDKEDRERAGSVMA
ncbi:hypothetical protein N0V88_007317 [Collariella sp. IMI 366227]|nr:hypothetical protein N0V88_007317 [Collariella sp. IMI 366227]